MTLCFVLEIIMFSKPSFKKNTVYPTYSSDETLSDSPQRKNFSMLADVMAELSCEKKADQWVLDLTNIHGSKSEKLLGKIYTSDERINISELIQKEKWLHHHTLVESILNQGPGHLSADWNIFLDSMYDRSPVTIQNPIKKTLHTVHIRLQLHAEKVYEVGRKYYFHVLFIDRNQEELCAIVMSNKSEHYQYFLHRISEITRHMPASTELQEIRNIVQMGKNLASDDYRDFLPENLKATLCRKGGVENETMTHWPLFYRLNNWIEQQKRLLIEAKSATILVFSTTIPTKDFLVIKEKVQSFELILFYMLKISSANPLPHQLNFVASQQNEEKYFECDIYDTDSLFSVYQLFQPSKTSILTSEQKNFIQACNFWRKEGGGIESFMPNEQESILRLSIFSNTNVISRQQHSKILKTSELDQFKNLLAEIDSYRKRAVLLVDDGLISIKFLLRETLTTLGLGKLANDSPVSQLVTAEIWQKMKFFMLNYEHWYIVCACNGAVAQELLDGFTPDVMITDENMPEKNGTDLIRWFREHRTDQDHVRIALHSSDTDKPWQEILKSYNAVFFKKADKEIFTSIFDFSREWSSSRPGP